MRDPITIITTVRDGEIFLDRYFANLRTILGTDDRVIIVDDGSVSPVSPPSELQKRDQIQLLHPGKVGRGAALNLAIENSETDLIAIQDIDDISLPDRLDKQVAFLAKHPTALLFAKAVSDRWTPSFRAVHRFAHARLLRSNPLHHSTLAMHRATWERAGGYDTDLACCIDLEFYLRAALRCDSKIWRLHAALIDRNLTLATRHFAQVPDSVYQQTLQSLVAQYRTGPVRGSSS